MWSKKPNSNQPYTILNGELCVPKKVIARLFIYHKAHFGGKECYQLESSIGQWMSVEVLGDPQRHSNSKRCSVFFFFCNNEDHLEILEETVGHLIVFFRCTSDLLGVSCIFILMGITWWSNFSWAHVVWTWEWENFGIIGPVAPKSKLEGRHDHLAWDLITNPSHLHLYHAIRSWWIYKK